MAARLDWLRGWSRRLDTAFEIPGTGIRFGWDPLLGLLPWLGDLVSPVFSIAVVVTAMQLGIPKVVQARMLLNVVIDALAGAVPIVGDAFDVAWKANEWNMNLLERHAWTEHPPSRSDWLFVGGIAAVMFAAASLPVVSLLLLWWWLDRSAF
jgi:Domain of unknown function (DUF4112)